MSEGFCEVDFTDYDDYDPVELFNERVIRQSRKVHACTECRNLIAVGETHWRKSYRFDGKFQTERVCSPCQEAAGEFQFHVLGGLLWENFYEEWAQGANLQGCLNRLSSVAAKARMTEQWRKWKKL